MAAAARGINNCAYYNTHAAGDTDWYASKRERDAAIDKLRAEAVARGLSRSASLAGITKCVKWFKSAAERDAFLERLRDSPDVSGGNYAGHQR